MSAPRRGLGRGLGSLIPTTPEEAPAEARGDEVASASPPDPLGSVPGGATAEEPEAVPPGGEELAPVDGATFTEIPLDQIVPNAVQPRHVFDEDEMAELVHSIREIGLLQPIVVRPRPQEPGYEIIMGERRWRAAQDAGLERIPSIVRHTDDVDMLRDALLENLHRSELNPLEEASAYAQLLEEFDCTHEELAQRIGRSRPQISNTLRLLRLSPAVQRKVAAGVLSAGHARSLLAVVDPEVQERLSQRVISEGISVRGLEEIVAVGEREDGSPRAKRAKPTAPGLEDVQDRLSERLETRVKVDLGKSKGRITVEFAGLEDLRRILDLIDPRNREDRVI